MGLETGTLEITLYFALGHDTPYTKETGEKYFNYTKNIKKQTVPIHATYSSLFL